VSGLPAGSRRRLVPRRFRLARATAPSPLRPGPRSLAHNLPLLENEKKARGLGDHRTGPIRGRSRATRRHQRLAVPSHRACRQQRFESPDYRIDGLPAMGWYGVAGARAWRGPSPVPESGQPVPPHDPTTGLLECPLARAVPPGRRGRVRTLAERGLRLARLDTASPLGCRPTSCSVVLDYEACRSRAALPSSVTTYAYGRVQQRGRAVLSETPSTAGPPAPQGLVRIPYAMSPYSACGSTARATSWARGVQTLRCSSAKATTWPTSRTSTPHARADLLAKSGKAALPPRSATTILFVGHARARSCPPRPGIPPGVPGPTRASGISAIEPGASGAPDRTVWRTMMRCHRSKKRLQPTHEERAAGPGPLARRAHRHTGVGPLSAPCTSPIRGRATSVVDSDHTCLRGTGSAGQRACPGSWGYEVYSVGRGARRAARLATLPSPARPARTGYADMTIQILPAARSCSRPAR